MKRIAVDQLKEDEVLAKEVSTSGGLVLIPKGTHMKRQYIERLTDLGIQYIYIEETEKKDSSEQNTGCLQKAAQISAIEEERIKNQCQLAVRETLDKFSHLGNSELTGIKAVAEEVIQDILEQPEVLYSVSGIRSKGDLVYSHCLNVCALSVLIALKMKLSAKRVREVAIGGLLHDIGYVYVPGDLIYRDSKSLKAEERTELKKHVIYGFEAIKSEKWLPAASRNIILYHHENLDGSGYPFRLEAERIRTEVRIVSICDTFDRLVYGFFCDAMKVHKALEEITSKSESQFDFEILKIFLESVAAYPNGTRVITNEGEKATVLRQNPKCPTRPVLQMEKTGREADQGTEYRDKRYGLA